jgi:cytochrome c-type biogenesis protein
MIGRIPIAFAAGFLSFLAPCVLPLVPGYLSAVSAVSIDNLGERGTARRVVAASVPFIIGFSVVFVILGAGASWLGSSVGLTQTGLEEIAGFIVIVLGLGFMGLLPLPERLLLPSLVGRARRSHSSALLGAAFGVCAAPCIGPVLATILVLAGSTSTIVQGSVLLLVYSLGLAIPFLIAGIAFTRAMGAFRWLRNHYEAIRFASGALLIGIGLLLFFDRFWWLNVFMNRALNAVGLGT